MCLDEGVTKEKENLILQILTIAEEVDIMLNEAKKAKNSTLLEGIEMIRKKLWMRARRGKQVPLFLSDHLSKASISGEVCSTER